MHFAPVPNPNDALRYSRSHYIIGSQRESPRGSVRLNYELFKSSSNIIRSEYNTIVAVKDEATSDGSLELLLLRGSIDSS